MGLHSLYGPELNILEHDPPDLRHGEVGVGVHLYSTQYSTVHSTVQHSHCTVQYSVSIHLPVQLLEGALNRRHVDLSPAPLA